MTISKEAQKKFGPFPCNSSAIAMSQEPLIFSPHAPWHIGMPGVSLLGRSAGPLINIA